MCGIAGVYDFEKHGVDVTLLQQMNDLQRHRGPDGEGYVLIDPEGREQALWCHSTSDSLARGGKPPFSLAFGHRRLAVIDLSNLGAQPMATSDGRLWVTYNGEIYNYVEIRDELKARGYEFRSASDTEVLLLSYREWGAQCLSRLNGMFAFAIWDGDQRRLFCARDRFGEKPFYYSWNQHRFAFASEIKGLFPVEARLRPNQRAVCAYLEQAMLDYSADTFFEGIHQLLPGHFLIIQNGRMEQRCYWTLPREGEGEDSKPNRPVEQFRFLFEDAVRLRLRSDVAVGFCLSGGLDSSAIVCMADHLQSSQNGYQSFSSCFDHAKYDEREFIQQVVERTHVTSRCTFPDPDDLLKNLDVLVWNQEEPVGSTSIFAQWAVMRLAKEHGVKVLLDGQGADEILAGYHSFFGSYYADLFLAGHVMRLLREFTSYAKLHGRPTRHLIASLVRALFPRDWVQSIRPVFTGSARWISPEFQRQWTTQVDLPVQHNVRLRDLQYRLLNKNGLRALLHYEDRNSMAFGLEARLPFLDFRLVEFLFLLSSDLKLREGWTKVILREALTGLLPERVRCRVDKMGFVTPEDLWFRDRLREPARKILNDSRTRSRGYLNVDQALKDLDAHVAGHKNISSTIWRWINLELWCRRFVDQSSCAISFSS